KYNREEVRSMDEIHALRKKGVLTGDALRPAERTNLLADYPQAAIEKAREKLEAAESGQSTKFSGRSISRFRAQTAGAVSLIDKLLRLIDRDRDRGNRSERLSERNVELIQRTLEADYNTPTQQTKKSAYAKYIGRCEGSYELSEGATPTPALEECPASTILSCQRQLS
nr:hypothetical protein [Burkholderiaceae bacterium]